MKVSQPERQVIAFVGDGSFLFTGQALWTAARYNIGVKVVICNNRLSSAVKTAVQKCCGKADSEFAAGLDNPRVDFVSLARSFGVFGQRVENVHDLEPALKKAFGTPGPELVEVVVEPA